MKAIIIFLAVTACELRPVYANTCSGSEAQLRSVSKLLSRGDTIGAERSLGPLQASHPDCDELILDRARLQAAKGDEAADETFVHYTTLEPRDAKGWAYLARYLLAQEAYRRADAAASLATDCDPGDPVAMAVKGQILDLKGKSDEGITLLDQAIRLDPDDAETRFQLGGIYDRSLHPKQAVKYFAEAIAINPSDARAWDYLALNLEPLGEIERAQQAYARGLSENQQGSYFDAFLPYNYGRFLMKRNQLSASKEQLDSAIVLTPQVRAVWYERARLNVRLKNLAQARTDAEKAASIDDPQGVIADLQIYVLLEQVYSRLGETALARKYAELSRVTPSPIKNEMDRTH